MKILYLVPDIPLTPNGYGGASALAFSHLELLYHSNHSLALALLPGWDEDQFARYQRDQPAQWQEVLSWVTTCEHLEVVPQSDRVGRWRPLLDAYRGRAYRAAADTDARTVSLKKLVMRVQPDLIWAEHWQPALVAMATGLEVPVVYSHHDWKWRIKMLRRGKRERGGRHRYRTFMQRRMEEDLVRNVAGCVSGSASEVRELKALGARNVGYFPTTVRPVEQAACAALDPPRVVHLGTLSATASREGLRRFMDVVWPAVQAQMNVPPELWIVGSTEGAPRDLEEKLAAAGAIRTGFVEDLASVLRCYDLHVMPWEHDTGTRTRLPVAFNHRQVVVATRAAVACLPEVRDGENCVLVEELTDMAGRIVSLCNNETRKRLGDAARETLLEAFTREAMQARFEAYVEECEKNMIYIH